MRNGTQEELDAAREDARLLPYDANFKLVDNDDLWKEEGYFHGDVVFRFDSFGADNDSVSFVKDGNDYAIYLGVDMLEAIK